MKIVCGDILSVNHGVIVHQVNCKKVMGAGLALAIRRKYPKHFADYIGNEPELGDIVTTSIYNGLHIIGVYGQYSYGRGGRYTNYSSLYAGLAKANSFAAQKKLPLYIPFGIGCGLAGGDWEMVQKIINRAAPNSIIVRKATSDKDAVDFWKNNETGNTFDEYMQTLGGK